MAASTATKPVQPRGTLFIVAAPSGGGKTSLVQDLINHLDNIELSISHTTRSIRPGEVDGQDYFFVAPELFEDMIKTSAFVEYAEVFGHLYGTSVAQIQERLDQGIDLVLDIDWQGAQQIKALFPEAVRIFILPPSLDILRERLVKRQQDKAEVIAHRMQSAQNEMQHVAEFDFIIVNEHFHQAANELAAIVQAERLKIGRQLIKQEKLLSFLLAAK